MRRLLILLGLAFMLQTGASADTLKLLDGKVITGTFLGGDARTIRMEVANKIEMFPISEVDSLSFGGGVAGAAPPQQVDPKKAKEVEKARKKAEEQAAKIAKEAEKAKQAADKAAAKAAEAAARAKGATSAMNAPVKAPKLGRFGKPPALGSASDAANVAKTAQAPVTGAAQTAQKVSTTANQAVATANQAAAVAADPAAAAGGIAQQAAQQAAQGAASQAAGAAAPLVSNAQAVESSVQSARSVARTASNAVDSGRAAAAGSSMAQSAGTASHSSLGTSSSSGHSQPVASPPPAAAASPVAASPTTASPATASPATVQAQTGAISAAAPSGPAPLQPSANAALEREPVESAAVPTGTVFRVRMVEAINTDIYHAGEVFRASLEVPLVSGGVQVPKGADVMLKLVKLPPARGASTSLYTLEAVSLRVDSRNLPFAAELMTQPGDALRGASGSAGMQSFRGAEAIHIPADGLISLRAIRLPNKR